MKAAVLYELNQPLQIVDGIQVGPLVTGQVLVKIAYSGVCHSQLMEARGGRGADPWLPHLLGHEATGVVQEIGPEVTKFQPGDRVVVGWIRGEGLNAGGGQFTKGGQKINAGAVTTFNELAVIAENRLVKLPEGISLQLGVLFGCAMPTGAGIVLNSIKPAPGSSIVVFGLGGIGTSALLATSLFSCSQVIAIDVEPAKLEFAKECGATHLINAAEEDPIQKVKEITQGIGVDYAVEAAGRIETIEMAFAMIKKGGGRLVFASHPPTGQKIKIDPHELISGKRIEGSWGGESKPDQDIPFFAQLYKQGKLPLEKMISRPYSLNEINQAMDDLASRKITRALIAIDPNL